MKFLFFALTFLISYNLKSQSQLDSLKKYSYICFFQNKETGIFENGTCFFYRTDSKLYIVSNYHVLSGMDPFTKIREFSIDTLFIKCKLLNSKDSCLVTTPIRLGTIEYFKFYEKPDLYAYNIKDLNYVEFNCINSLIDTSFFNKKPTEVYSFGYPSILQKDISALNETLFKGYYEDDYTSLDSLIKISNTPEKNDPNIISKIKALNFLISPASMKGISGSPLFGKFIKYRNRKKIIVYKFIGVMFGQLDDLNISYVIRADIANDYLKNLK